MADTVKALRLWLETLDDDDEVGVDAGGLTLQVVDYDDNPATFELGGIPELEPTDDDIDDAGNDDRDSRS